MQQRGTKIGQLILASTGFFWAFLMWFATAAFSVAIMKEFSLQKAQLAVLASSAMWLAPILRQIIGVVVDKIGAPKSAALVLTYTGIFSILSAFSRNYTELFITRLIVATAGIFFVIGIQHVSKWFDEHEIGLSEGIYAGTGNVGAGVGALMLPRIFGLDYRTAFIYLGVGALILAVIYLKCGVAASAERLAAAAHAPKKSSGGRDVAYVATRFAAIALMLQYAMSFGLEIGMNAWLPGYYRIAFEQQLHNLGYTDLKAIAVAAGSLAAVQSFNASLWRPFSGVVSDLFDRNRWTPWPFLAKTDMIAPRLHWVFTAQVAVTIMMVLLTFAGLTGNLALSVITLAFLGFTISWNTGSNFGVTPVLFHKKPGVATGYIGGVCTVFGIIYPLIFGAMPNIHMGYAVTAVTMFIPFMLVFILAFPRGKPVDVDRGFGDWRSFGMPEPLGDKHGEREVA